MQTLAELGEAIAQRRRALGVAQGVVAQQAGVTQANLSRLERGRCVEFGARKLLAILAVLEMEVRFVAVGEAGTLDELRAERGTMR